MIEDAELRELFQIESEEHLQSLDDGLLRLETHPQDSATLEEVFRAAHSLKGTARMLGVTGVETLSHHLEDELGHARRGRVELTPPVIDRMSAGLNAIRLLVQEAVSGTPAKVDFTLVLGQMKGTVPLDTAPAETESLPPETVIAEPSLEVPSPEATEPEVLPAITVEPAPKVLLSPLVEPEVQSAPPVAVQSAIIAAPEPPSSQPGLPSAISNAALQTVLAATATSCAELTESKTESVADKAEVSSLQTDQAALAKNDFKIQTMRVPPAKLDALMTLASELTVTTHRVNRGLGAFDAMGELWEEWNKDLARQRLMFFSTQGTAAVNAKTYAEFHAREQERLARLQVLWEQIRATVYEDATRLNFVADELEEGIRNVRLLPLSTIFNLFPRAVRDLAREQGKDVQLVLEGGDTAADKRILEELKDPLLHMVRNAIDHGIEPSHERRENGKAAQATLRLRAAQTSTNVLIELRDDGRGLDVEAIKRTALRRQVHSAEELATMSNEQLQMLIFAPGFSTSPIVTDVSGRGVGLDVVRANVENLKGSIEVASVPGSGTTFLLRLPLTLATTRVLLVKVASHVYALPIEYVQGMMPLDTSKIFTVEGRENLLLGEEPVPLARLSQLLELSETAATHRAMPVCVVIATGHEKVGLIVDELVDEQEVVLKPLGSLLKRVRNVSGSTILGAGEVCMVLNPHDLVKSGLRHRGVSLAPTRAIKAAPETQRKLVLLAEDSITTRTQEKRILESAEYEVVTAVDGADAWQKLPTREFDAVVSDVEMPNMTGLMLAAKIRENQKYNELPIILVTSLASDEDKQRGVEVGANAYITKGTFEQKVLLDTLRRLI
jgi:two-component system chemotaxis sensor kinase CheA